MNKIVVGFDQSYQDTGISIAVDGVLKAARSVYLKNLKNNTCRREKLRNEALKAFKMVSQYEAEIMVIIERIRLRSQGFINMNYIKGIGALDSVIVDTAACFNFPVYSVDTRAWKTAVVGTASSQSNPYGIDPKKWPTIQWCIQHGYENKIIDCDVGKRKRGVIHKNGKSFTYNDNVADSICISLYSFTPELKLQEEH